MPSKAQGHRKTDVRRLVESLESVHGLPESLGRTDPVEELVACILSQHTADVNSIPAFERLMTAFPSWDDLVRAGQERVAEVIKHAGLANQKAKSIIRALQTVRQKNGAFQLENLRDMPVLEARRWLEGLPGVGPKTASIVLCFSLGMPVVPVDTHVYRVSVRLGLVSPTVNPDKAHDVLMTQVPPEMAYRFHIAVIQHGRKVCRARRPECCQCVLASICPKVGTTQKPGL